MTVTALIPETKGRYRVCLQGEADLVLYGKELKQFGIAEGTDLSPEQYRRILEEVLIPRARKRAMHILERMDQTTAQLREKLQRSQYPEQVVEDAIAYVASFHYIDDERFARNFIRAYQQSRSRLRISRDLQGKGINRDLSTGALRRSTRFPRRIRFGNFCAGRDMTREPGTASSRIRCIAS